VKVHRRPNVMALSLAAFCNDTGSDMALSPILMLLIHAEKSAQVS
jgi:hypothetical protein